MMILYYILYDTVYQSILFSLHPYSSFVDLIDMQLQSRKNKIETKNSYDNDEYDEKVRGGGACACMGKSRRECEISVTVWVSYKPSALPQFCKFHIKTWIIADAETKMITI